MFSEIDKADWPSITKKYKRHLGAAAPPWLRQLTQPDAKAVVDSCIRLSWRLPMDLLCSVPEDPDPWSATYNSLDLIKKPPAIIAKRGKRKR
jgi:hypothetical protein